MSETVGFIGLGIMGEGMAARILQLKRAAMSEAPTGSEPFGDEDDEDAIPSFSDLSPPPAETGIQAGAQDAETAAEDQPKGNPSGDDDLDTDGDGYVNLSICDTAVQQKTGGGGNHNMH